MLVAKTLVIVDLEFTSWEGFMASGWSMPGRHREVVQIGAVRLDATAGFEETAAFQALARPLFHPRLSDYFIDLTGIGQEAVDRDGRPFPQVLGDFEAFLAADGPVQLASNGIDGPILAENCGWHGIPVPPAITATLDVSRLLAGLLGRKGHVGSATLPGLLGLEMGGRAHDALDDARAVAAALRSLRATGRL